MNHYSEEEEEGGFGQEEEETQHQVGGEIVEILTNVPLPPPQIKISTNVE